MDIFKLLKALNSAQASWQISLAIVFGMISGLLPLATPLNLLLVFIVFSINVPIGIFFFMSVVFGGLGLILDPVLASVGYDILTNSSLNALFSSAYNNPIALWSSYNHTIVMGASVVSLTMAIPLFFVFNFLINKYRVVLETKFKDSKFFSWLNPYTEEKLAKKSGVIRWWGSALFLAIGGVIVSIVMLVIDPLVKYTLEYTLTKATNRTFYIDEVDCKIFDTSIGIKNISILSRHDSDDIKIDKVDVKLNTKRLLQKKYDFEIVSFGNITLNTTLKGDRGTHITQTVDNSVNSSIKNSKKSVNTVEQPKLPSADALIAKEGLESVKRAKIIQEESTALKAKWKGKVESSKKQTQKIKDIKKRLKLLEKKAKDVKKLKDVAPIIQEAKQLKKELKAIKKSYEALKAEYKKDSKTIKAQLKDIKTLPQKDFQHLKGKYSLDSNGAMNLIGTHLSSSLESYLRMGKKYYAMVEPYISSDEKEETTPEQERMTGRWIKYKKDSIYPEFVIRKLNANIIQARRNFDVKVKDISDNQKIYKKPLVATIQSKSQEYKMLNIDFEHNELSKDAKSTIKAVVDGFNLKKYQPMKQLSLDDSIIQANSNIVITNFKSLKADMNADVLKTTLNYDASSSKTDKIISSILSKIDSFKVKSSVGGTIQKPEITLNSDLDKKIAKGLKEEIGKEVERYKKKLKAKIDKRFKEELDKLDLGEFNALKGAFDGGVSDSGSLQKRIKQNISEKGMKKKLKKQLKEKAKKAIAEKLKLF